MPINTVLLDYLLRRNFNKNNLSKMATLKGIFDGVMKYKTFIVAVVAVVLTVIMLQTCQSNKNLRNQIAAEKAKTDQNIAALTTDLQTYKDKYDNVGFIKPILQLTKDELKLHNPVLYAELEKELGEVQVIWKEKIVYRDTGSVKNVVKKLSKDQYELGFDYTSKDNVLNIVGRSTFGAVIIPSEDTTKSNLEITHGFTYFDSTRIQFGLTTGIRQDPDKIYRIFVKPSPPNNNIRITSLEGADVSNFITPQTPEIPRRFGVSAYLGWGATIDTKTRTAALGPSAGLAVTYTIFSFGKKK